MYMSRCDVIRNKTVTVMVLIKILKVIAIFKRAFNAGDLRVAEALDRRIERLRMILQQKNGIDCS